MSRHEGVTTTDPINLYTGEYGIGGLSIGRIYDGEQVLDNGVDKLFYWFEKRQGLHGKAREVSSRQPTESSIAARMNEVFGGFIKHILPQAQPEMVAVAITPSGKTLGMHMTAAEANQLGKAPVRVTMPEPPMEVPVREAKMLDTPPDYQPARALPKKTLWDKLVGSHAVTTALNWLLPPTDAPANSAEAKPAAATAEPPRREVLWLPNALPTVQETPQTANSAPETPVDFPDDDPDPERQEKDRQAHKVEGHAFLYGYELEYLTMLAEKTHDKRANGTTGKTDDELLDELFASAKQHDWSTEETEQAFEEMSAKLYPGDPFIVQLKRAEMADALAAHYITRADNEAASDPIEEPVIIPTAEVADASTPPPEVEAPEYGSMPKAAGDMALAAWLAGRHNLVSSDTLSPLEFQKEKARLYAELVQTTAAWGWNAAAINGAAADFEAHFADLQPAPIKEPTPEPAPEPAPHQYLITHPDGTTTPITLVASNQKPFIRKTAPTTQRATPSKDKKPAQLRWRRIVGGVAVAAVGVAGVLLGVKACSTDGATPEPKPTATSTSSAGNTSEEKPGDTGKDNQDTKSSKYSTATQDMKKVRELKDGRIFVDAAPWTQNRSTYWSLADETIRANEDRKPTVPEINAIKNALLRANHETEASARRMPVGHDMFLLTKAQYDAAMARARR